MSHRWRVSGRHSQSRSFLLKKQIVLSITQKVCVTTSFYLVFFTRLENKSSQTFASAPAGRSPLFNLTVFYSSALLMLSDGKTGGEELNVGQQWIQMGVRLLRRPDLDFGSAEWLAGCVCDGSVFVCDGSLCVCVCDGSLCVCVGSACQIFEYTQSRHIKMVY